MKKKLLPIALLLSTWTFAQVGIGVDVPDQSAILEIGTLEKNKGLIIPNISLVNLTDKTVIQGGNPKEGLLVYNTVTDKSNGLEKGFYYWGKSGVDVNDVDIFKWIRVVGNTDLTTLLTVNLLEV